MLPMPFVGDALRERCLTRSYKACRRELVGVWGTVTALEPRWWVGVDGTEPDSLAVGVLLPESEGVRELEGVANPARRELVGVANSVREGDRELEGVSRLVMESDRPRVEGVFGKTIVFFEGVPALLDGVIGNGTANSCGLFVGDQRGSLDGDLEGDEGVGEDDLALARMAAEEGDLGEDAASRRVSADGLLVLGRAGKSAVGKLGTVILPACN